MNALYTLHNIHQQYNGRPVLAVDSFVIETGSIVGIVGPNGGGKSTLMRLLAFLEPPHSGSIHFAGTDVGPRGLSSGQLTALRRKATLLTQEPYLLQRSVEENVAYGLKVRKERNIAARVASALETVGLAPAEFCKRQWFELSGGEAQRVALAARIALSPRALLLDEPTSSLDEESTDRIREAALHIRKTAGTTLVIVSHDREWLASVADTIRTVRQGRLQPME